MNTDPTGLETIDPEDFGPSDEDLIPTGDDLINEALADSGRYITSDGTLRSIGDDLINEALAVAGASTSGTLTGIGAGTTAGTVATSTGIGAGLAEIGAMIYSDWRAFHDINAAQAAAQKANQAAELLYRARLEAQRAREQSKSSQPSCPGD